MYNQIFKELFFLLPLQDHALQIVAAYGSSKDIAVYSSISLKPEQIYIVGKTSKKQQANAQVNYLLVLMYIYQKSYFYIIFSMVVSFQRLWFCRGGLNPILQLFIMLSLLIGQWLLIWDRFINKILNS